MAFDIQKNKRLASEDGVTEVDSDSNENTMEIVEQASKSNVIATQAWVSKILRGFCSWTRVFHTGVLHAIADVFTTRLHAKEIHADEIHASSVVLQNQYGGMVKLQVGQDGKIDIQETISDVFVYPGDCLVREFLYRTPNIPANFAGLTPYQTLLNFVPFVGWKNTELDGKTCYILCTADGKDEFVNRTLLFNCPDGMVVKNVAIVDEDGNTITRITVPYEDNIEQLTINLPCFKNIGTGEICKVRLPKPSSIWSGDTDVFPEEVPPPQCSGFVPGPDGIPARPEAIGSDIFTDEIPPAESEIAPGGKYEVIQEEYTGNTYYNIPLKKNAFNANLKTQYLMVELMGKIGNGLI